MNVALYARYSSDKQTEMSIEAQVRACNEYCAKKKYVIVKQYVDKAESARSDNRPAFQQMISDAKAGLFECLIVHKIDRFSRDRYDDAFYKRVLKKSGVSIEYVEQNIDGSPESIILESVLVGMAEYYSKNLARETLKGLNENAHKAKFNGGVPPFGYDIVDGKYVINEQEASGVRLIFSMYLEGYGYGKISDELFERGYKTKRGGRFSKNSLHDFLLNPRYIGTYVFGKVKKNGDGKRNTHSHSTSAITVKNAIPPIISMEIWDAIQEKLMNNTHRPGAFSAKRIYILSGLVKCGECGSMYVGATSSARGVKYSYYTCGKKERKSGDCSSRMIPKKKLEDKVIAEIEKNLFTGPGIENMIYDINEANKINAIVIAEDLKRLEVEKQQITHKIKNLVDMMEDGKGSAPLKERLQQNSDELEIIEIRIQEANRMARRTVLTPKQVTDVMMEYKQIIKEKTPEGLRSLVNNFVDKVIIEKNDTVKVVFKISVRSYMVPGGGTSSSQNIFFFEKDIINYS